MTATSVDQRQKEQEAKEHAFVQKFDSRIRMWYKDHVDKQGKLMEPLPIIMDMEGNPKWLNRESRRKLQGRKKPRNLW